MHESSLPNQRTLPIDWDAPLETLEGYPAELIHVINAASGNNTHICVVTEDGVEWASDWRVDGAYRASGEPSERDIRNVRVPCANADLLKRWAEDTNNVKVRYRVRGEKTWQPLTADAIEFEEVVEDDE